MVLIPIPGMPIINAPDISLLTSQSLASPRLYHFNLDPNPKPTLTILQTGFGKAVLRGRISLKWKSTAESESISVQIAQENNGREVQPIFSQLSSNLLFLSPTQELDDKLEIIITISLHGDTKFTRLFLSLDDLDIESDVVPLLRVSATQQSTGLYLSHDPSGEKCVEISKRRAPFRNIYSQYGNGTQINHVRDSQASFYQYGNGTQMNHVQDSQASFFSGSGKHYVGDTMYFSGR